jgi:hypothetical protein
MTRRISGGRNLDGYKLTCLCGKVRLAEFERLRLGHVKASCAPFVLATHASTLAVTPPPCRLLSFSILEASSTTNIQHPHLNPSPVPYQVFHHPRSFPSHLDESRAIRIALPVGLAPSESSCFSHKAFQQFGLTSQDNALGPYHTIHVMATTTSWDPVTSDAYSTPTPSVVLKSNNDSSSSDGSFGDIYQNYFAFIAVIIAVCLVGGCVFYRRKKQIIRHANLSRQAALSRDIEDQGLRTNRGWGWGALSRDYSSGPNPHGQPLSQGLRGAMGVSTPWRRRREEEGFNEAGEAPPAYKSAPDHTDTILESAHTVALTHITTPAMPRPTIAREHTGLKPPDYTEAVVSPVSHGRASSSATIPTLTVASTHNHTTSDGLPNYNDSHERR